MQAQYARAWEKWKRCKLHATALHLKKKLRPNTSTSSKILHQPYTARKMKGKNKKGYKP